MKKLLFKELKNTADNRFSIEKCPLVGDFYIHTHDFYELVIILKGTAIHIVNEKEYLIKAGDTFIIHGELSHGYRDVRGLEYINIMFDLSIVQQLSLLNKDKGFQALFFIEPLYRKEQNFGSKLVLTPSQLKKAEEIADILLREYRQNNDSSQAMTRSYFTILLITLSRYYSSNRNESNRKVLQMAEAVAYIEENYLRDISIRQLSDLACISNRHFIRVFKKNYGATPMDYVIRLRLNHSMSLLKETSLPIAVIASESGFGDPNYYSRKFKEIFSVSPSEYRNRK